MSLNDAERRALAEIEQQLAGDHPRLTLVPPPGRPRLLPTVPVALGAVVFLTAIAWYAVLVGDFVPVVLALPVVGAVATLLWWQHTDSGPAPDGEPGARPVPFRNTAPPADS